MIILNGLFGRRLYTGFMSGQDPPPNQLPSLTGRVIYVLIGVAALLLGMRDLLKSASVRFLPLFPRNGVFGNEQADVSGN